jgi:hypothetical protein
MPLIAWKFIEIDMKANNAAALVAQNALPPCYSCVSGNTLTWILDPYNPTPNAVLNFPPAPQFPLRIKWKIFEKNFDAAFEGNYLKVLLRNTLLLMSQFPAAVPPYPWHTKEKYIQGFMMQAALGVPNYSLADEVANLPNYHVDFVASCPAAAGGGAVHSIALELKAHPIAPNLDNYVKDLHSLAQYSLNHGNCACYWIIFSLVNFDPTNFVSHLANLIAQKIRIGARGRKAAAKYVLAHTRLTLVKNNFNTLGHADAVPGTLYNFIVFKVKHL